MYHSRYYQISFLIFPHAENKNKKQIPHLRQMYKIQVSL